MFPASRRSVVTPKQSPVKKYIVKLGGDERDGLNAVIQKGKTPARQVLKARILLKADASHADEGWSDQRIAEALDTSFDTVARTRQHLVEGGIDAALTRKHSPSSARRRTFDGAGEVKLIALACSEPPPSRAQSPKDRARWMLKLLEDAVVARNIVGRASDNTIRRTLKKYAQAASADARGHSAKRQCCLRTRHGGRAGGLSEAARAGSSRRLPGRHDKTTHQGNARAGPGAARTAGPTRL